VLTVAGAAGGAVSGTLLGAAGGLIPAGTRFAAAMVLGIAVLPVGALAAAGVRVPVPQWDRETPQPWLSRGVGVWSMVHGLTLGAGWLTRIEFPAWYVLPVVAACSGSPSAGALVLGTYGLVRVGMVWPMLLGLRHRQGEQTHLSDWLFAHKDGAHRLGGWVVLVSGLAVAVAYALG